VIPRVVSVAPGHHELGPRRFKTTGQSVPLSRNERRQLESIQQALLQDRDFAASMAPGRPMHRRFLTVLFFAGVVMTLSGVVIAQLAPGGLVLCFYGVIATAGSLMFHRRMVTGTG
jgi:hypothetical protein